MYDVIVIGLGAMGSAAACALARGRRRVLGLDRFTPPHTLGSSHGRTRIIREAYFEHPLYVPLVRRALECWRELERASGRTLLRQTGGISIGPEDGVLVRGVLASAREHGIPHRVLSAAGVRRLYPVLQPLDGMVGVVEDRAGVLFAEACLTTMLALAARAGAELHTDEPVSGWHVERGGEAPVRVTTDRGEYAARQLVIAAGSWTPSLVPELAPALTVTRQVIHWFEPAAHAASLAPDQCPVTLWEYAPDRMFYTLPDFGDGVKVGVHTDREVTDPEHADRRSHPQQAARVIDLLRRFMPHAKGRLAESQVCLYTNTPDLHFVVDFHPAHGEVLVLSPCSGHGFKFASVIGEVAAELLATGGSRFDLSAFRVERLGA